MSINGRDLRGVSHGEALHILKAPSPRVVLVIARDKNRSPLQQNGTPEKEVKRRHDSVNNKGKDLKHSIHTQTVQNGWSSVH